VTWNPSDKAAGITLSNGNLTAHMASDTDYAECGVRATIAISGKKYFRLVMDDLSGSDPNTGVGIASVGATLTATYPTTYSCVGNGTHATLVADLSTILLNNAYAADGPATLAVNDIIDVAVDTTNNKFWIRKNGAGAWTGDGDPATNTAGVSITAGQTWYPYFGGRNGVGVTARFADDSSGTAPSGFSWMG
jgi:hypothetical protein